MNKSKYSGDLLLYSALLLALYTPAHGASFNMHTDNAALQLVLRAMQPVFDATWSPGDATLIFRSEALVNNAWFDAIAPYRPEAVGIYSDLGRRPRHESSTNYHRNVAILYASYQVLNSLLPANNEEWRNLLLSVGLDPDDSQRNTTTSIGIGNMAGDAVVAGRIRDGMNQLGDENGCRYNCRPYADYLDYKPVNTAYELIDPSRWQPAIKSRNGIFTIQHFVTPQYKVTRPYTYSDPTVYRVPVPHKSNVDNYEEYKEQAVEVLAASAALNDVAKMKAELFDDKGRGYARAIIHAAVNNGLPLDDYVTYSFMALMAAFDTGVSVWDNKYVYDAVRPFSAIAHIYGNAPVTAWGGPGKGTVSDLPGNQWTSYLAVADHPEYPSGSASFCAAIAQASRNFFGSDELHWNPVVKAGSSVIEPGITPARRLALHFPTWTDWFEDCGQARVDGGVHFRAAIEHVRMIGDPIADLAYDLVMWHVAGRPEPPRRR